MPVEPKELNGGKLLDVRLTGKLVKEDYETFVPTVERLVNRHGKIDMLVEMHDFRGWTTGALWEDTNFAVRYFRDVARLAVIGKRKWQKGMTTLCKPFTAAAISYFESIQMEAARSWIQSAQEMPPSAQR